MNLKPGKLPQDLLEKLLKKFYLSDSVVLGPGVGIDSAVIDLGEKYLVVSSDPITFVTSDVGFYTIAVNINDVAVTGAIPEFMTVTILLPEGKTDDNLVEKIFDDIARNAEEFKISIVGGHTEVTSGVDRVITSSAIFGFVEKDRLVRQDGAEPGDILIMTKLAGIEGTSIIAREIELSRYFEPHEIEEMKNFYRNPGIVVLDDVKCIMEVAKPTAMHDPTEGGIAQAIHELAKASRVGMEIYGDEIQFHPYTLKLSQILDFNPLGLISSGALLATLKPEDTEKVLNHCKKFHPRIIGKVKPRDFGVKIRHGKELKDLPEFPQDEITRIL